MFASGFFNPVVLQGQTINTIENNDYLLKFCVSVLWRVLLNGIDDIIEKKNTEYKDIQLALEQVAENWRKFLLDEKELIDEKIYFFKLNYKNGVDSSVKEYIEHSIDKNGFYWDCWRGEPMVYVKLDVFVIIATLTPIELQPYWCNLWTNQKIYPINYEGGNTLVLEHQYDNLPDFVKRMIQYQVYQYEKIVINTFTKNE